MKATQLFAELQSRGVRLWPEGEGEATALGYEAPPGVLKPRVLAAMKASKLELLTLLKAQVAADTSPPQVLTRSSSWDTDRETDAGALFDHAAAWVREILRPDLREPLHLEALDLDPPEDSPTSAAWVSQAVWVRDLGVWQRCGLCVPTAATRANWMRYMKARQGQDLPEYCLKLMKSDNPTLGSIEPEAETSE